MTKKNYLNSLQTINGTRIDDFNLQHLSEKYAWKETESKEQKEIIRRLRIQNKKLLEQVIKLKEENKKTRFNKSQVLNHINELLKLISG